MLHPGRPAWLQIPKCPPSWIGCELRTGNTSGYTQFAAATKNGSRSALVSINSQITPHINPDRFPELRRIYTLAVCAALAR